MSGMRLLPLGVGDAFTALYYSTCLAIEAEGQWLLVDCPHPIRKMMREAANRAGLELDADRIAGVALSHLHADHSSGLEGLGYFSFFVMKRKLALLTHPKVAARLWEGHLAAGMEHLLRKDAPAPDEHHLDDYFELHPLDEAKSVRFGPFEIECRRTIHHIPTTAMRIRAGGRTLGYSSDTAFDPSLIAWLAEADLVVHETNYGIHTPYERLAELPPELRAKMRLVHYPDDFDLASSNIEPLEQGRIYPV
jgi:ribonuclease BN (tRNA processing enzyme)